MSISSGSKAERPTQFSLTNSHQLQKVQYIDGPYTEAITLAELRSVVLVLDHRIQELDLLCLSVSEATTHTHTLCFLPHVPVSLSPQGPLNFSLTRGDSCPP